MGVGDLAVGKRIKASLKAFYGRMQAYETGINHDDDTKLTEALKRNLYRKNETINEKILQEFCLYLRKQTAHLQNYSVPQFCRAEIEFQTP